MTVPAPGQAPQRREAGVAPPDPSGVMPAARVPGLRSMARAMADLRGALGLWRFACALGWLDVRLRYRGSALGPLWITLSSAIMVASMGLIYGRLFHQDLARYLPFLALSLTLWQVGLSGILQDACTCFTDAEGAIRSMRTPYAVQALRVIVRNAIVFAHNIVVPFAVFAIFHAWPGMVALASVPGVLVWLLDGFAACLLLGAICARFRDVPPIVGSVLQIAFYVTPIIWRPEQLGHGASWLMLNPFYPLLEIVRAPLLGAMPGAVVWGEALALSCVFCAVSLVAFARVRARLSFWV
jgi:lipopolysaccharide transport system permease protein